MRYLAVAIIAVALVAAGYLAADVSLPGADAQGTPSPHTRWKFAEYPAKFVEIQLNLLPEDCIVELAYNSTSDTYGVAWACPD